MDTESFFFIGFICSLSAAAISLLPVPKVKGPNCIRFTPAAISNKKVIDFSTEAAVIFRGSSK